MPRKSVGGGREGLNISLPKEVNDRLRGLAAKKHLSASTLAMLILENFMNEQDRGQGKSLLDFAKE